MIKELELLEAICRGVDPRDGTFLETPRDPDLDKVRLNYLAKLRRMVKRFNSSSGVSSSTSRPAMHGKPWTTGDDEALSTAWESDNFATAAFLGERFGRGEGAILARLVHLGLFRDRELAREANSGRVAIKGASMGLEGGNAARRSSGGIAPELTQRSAVVRITEEFLASGLSARGGYSRRQLELLGVSWPPPKGWKRSVMDGIITDELAAEFVGLAECNTCEQVDAR